MVTNSIVCMHICVLVQYVLCTQHYDPGMVWYVMVRYGMVWYGMVWYGMVWYGKVWYDMVWCGMVYCTQYGDPGAPSASSPLTASSSCRLRYITLPLNYIYLFPPYTSPQIDLTTHPSILLAVSFNLAFSFARAIWTRHQIPGIF